MGVDVGTTVAPAKLMTASGQAVELTTYAKEQKKRNLLLIFFRTGNCGICVGQLTDLAQRFDAIGERNAALLAISLDDAITQTRTAEKISKKFPLLLDPDGVVVKRFDVFNPQDRLSRPSTFVIGPDQKILYKYVGGNLTDRPSTDTILAELEKHSGKPAARGVATTPK